MEYLIYLVLGALGLAYYEYNARKAAETSDKLANTAGQDYQLKKDQQMVDNEISKVDARISELKEQHKDQSQENKTLEELASEARKNNK